MADLDRDTSGSWTRRKARPAFAMALLAFSGAGFLTFFLLINFASFPMAARHSEGVILMIMISACVACGLWLLACRKGRS